MRLFDAFFAETFGFRDPELIQGLSKASVLENVKRGTILTQIGERPVSVMFLMEGIVRGYIVDENGQEMTDCFAHRSGDVLIGCSGLETPSLIAFETLTPCTILRVSTETLNQLMQSHPEMILAYSHNLMEALLRHWEIKRILYQPAMQRYRWFLENYPSLIDQISNKHIASFLGITPVTLSRLRRQLRDGQ